MPIDFDDFIDRTSSDSAKWARYRGSDVIPMWVADMDFRSPEAVIQALVARAEHGVFGYTHPSSDLVAVFVERMRDRFDWEVDPDWLVWLPGVVTGLNLCCRLGAEPAPVATATPVYYPFLDAGPNAGRPMTHIPLEVSLERERRTSRQHWYYDFDRMAEALVPETSVFLLCNPHNPVGRALTREELTRIAELCVSREVIICSDEIHCDLILDEEARHVPTATLGDEVARRTITMMAPSKTFNLPGLGCAVAIIPDQRLRARFRRVARGVVPSINVFGLEAALAAFREGTEWLDGLIAYLKRNRDELETAVAGMGGLEMSHVEATYLAWIDCRSLPVPDATGFFEKAGVGLSDGRPFGGEGFVRLNFGCRRDLLTEALGRVSDAVASL